MNEFMQELDLIERLMTNGDFGEARFMVRRILLDQKQKTCPEQGEIECFIEFLNQLQHKLLVYESLTDIHRMIGMIRKARQRLSAGKPVVAPTLSPKALRILLLNHLSSNKKLRIFSKAKNRTHS